MNPSDEQLNTRKILTGLVKEVLSKHDVYYTKPQSPILAEKDIKAAIANATKQIETAQRERVEKVEHVYLVAWSIVHANHSTAAVQGDEMDSCNNPDCQSIQAALAELQKEVEDEQSATGATQGRPENRTTLCPSQKRL